MTNTTFSVLIPTRGTSPHLNAAMHSLESAIDADDVEVVIVVDGPAAFHWNPSGPVDVRVMRSEGTGISDALNTGIEAARGAFIVRMDDDDLCHPDRFRDLRRLCANQPDLVAGSTVTFGASRLRYARPARTPARLRLDLLHRGYGFAHPASTMRREALCRAGGYRRECDGSEDLDLWFRLLERQASYLGSAHVHLYYRVHAGQVSRASQRVEPARVISSQPDAALPCRSGCPGPVTSLRAELGARSARPCPGYAHDLRYRDLLHSTALPPATRIAALARRTWHLAVSEAVGAQSWWSEGRVADAY